MIVIVTDSTAYITHDEAAQLGAVIVPMSYSFADGQSFSEGCIEADSSAEQQVANHIDSVHTSQATFAAFYSTFDRLRKSGYEVLCLTMSSRLSGTYANAVLAARELGGRHIAVVDSLSTCAGLYLLVREAHRRIAAGDKLSVIAKQLDKLRHRVRLYFSVEDMTPLRRSGRLGNVRMSVSTMLNIRPMLEVRDGAVVSAGLARGRVDQANKLCAFCKSAKGLIVVDSFLGEDTAMQLPGRLAGEGREIERRRTGAVLGAHLGRGCVGVAFIEEAK